MMATSTQATMVVNSNVVKWMEEMSPRLSDFSIEYILSHKGPGGNHGTSEYTNNNDEDSMSDGNSTSQQQYDWLQCTRYRPPKLQRSRRKEGRQRRKPGRNPRIPFSGTQVAVLEERFRVGHYLSSTEVERLSNLLCLSETRVQNKYIDDETIEKPEHIVSLAAEVEVVAGTDLVDDVEIQVCIVNNEISETDSPIYAELKPMHFDQPSKLNVTNAACTEVEPSEPENSKDSVSELDDTDEDATYKPHEKDSDDSLQNDAIFDSSDEGEIDNPASVRIEPENNNNEKDFDDNKERKGLKRKRSKFPNQNEWKRIKQRRLKQLGLEHTNTVNKKVLDKSVKEKDCSKCPHSCGNKFSYEERKFLNNQYWAIGNSELQKQYISSLIKQEEKKSTRTVLKDASRRKFTKSYFLIKDNKELKVCKGFFLATFNLSGKFTDLIVSQRDINSIVKRDSRGRHTPAVKRPEENKDLIRCHIQSFPTLPSHYARKDSNKQYLESTLNLNKMYSLYVDKCVEEGVSPEKQWLYRDIFNKEFNLSFHIPKNDVCDQCYKYDHLNKEEKELQKVEHEQHIKRKNLARNLKNSFKEKAVQGECHLGEFDLQAVLYCPKTNAKSLFYKNKLSVYNFTILHVEAKAAHCYMWHEGQGNRGSAEIATCLHNFLTQFSDKKPFYFFSDTCSGQNRNINISTMFLNFVKKYDIPEINHLYFESGHSQMECDSIHANIENKTKHLDVYDPNGWYTAVRMAGSNSNKRTSHNVCEMSHGDFYNFTELQQKLIKNRKFDTEGNPVNWMKIKWFLYKKDDTQHIYFKYDQSLQEFKKIEVGRVRRKLSMENCDLSPKYTSPIKIKEKKLKDLLSLCQMGIIRKPYHSFYKSLMSSNNSINDTSDTESNN